MCCPPCQYLTVTKHKSIDHWSAIILKSSTTEEALANDVQVAVCSTSNERAVSTIVRVMLGEAIAARMPVFAGDVVAKKKPAPDIYLMAAEHLNINPARCVVVEDSRIGLLAAKAAGMRCVVTTSSYTESEDFALADAVFDCIGDDPEARFGVGDLTTPGSAGSSGCV